MHEEEKLNEDELLLLAEKASNQKRRRVVERPNSFRKLASLNNRALDSWHLARLNSRATADQHASA
jgi:hypothetical protein